jgi:FixJ family two-component response regulator
MKNEMRARWMVVDNDADALEAVSTLLTAAGIAEICPFNSATEALDAFVAAPDAFHLVVTDLEMPGMNGVDLRRHLHALSPSLRVLLATGGGLFTEEYAVRSGFCGLLQKPFSLTTFRQVLEGAETRTLNRTAS